LNLKYELTENYLEYKDILLINRENAPFLFLSIRKNTKFEGATHAFINPELTEMREKNRLLWNIPALTIGEFTMRKYIPGFLQLVIILKENIMAITQMAPEKAITNRGLKNMEGTNISAAYFLCDRTCSHPGKDSNCFMKMKKAKPLSGPSANFRTFHPKWPDSLNQLESKKGIA